MLVDKIYYMYTMKNINLHKIYHSCLTPNNISQKAVSDKKCNKNSFKKRTYIFIMVSYWRFSKTKPFKNDSYKSSELSVPQHFIQLLLIKLCFLISQKIAVYIIIFFSSVQ